MFAFLGHTLYVLVAEVQTTTVKLVDVVAYEYKTFRESKRNNKIKRDLRRKMKHSNTYSEWQEHALEYDELKGK